MRKHQFETLEKTRKKGNELQYSRHGDPVMSRYSKMKAGRRERYVPKGELEYLSKEIKVRKVNRRLTPYSHNTHFDI